MKAGFTAPPVPVVPMATQNTAKAEQNAAARGILFYNQKVKEEEDKKDAFQKARKDKKQQIANKVLAYGLEIPQPPSKS